MAEFRGPDRDVDAELTEETTDDLKSAIRRLLAEDLHGDFCRITPYEDYDEISVVVSHGAPIKTMPIVAGDREEVIPIQAMKYATLRYSASEGPLRIGGVAKARQSDVAEAFAMHILGRPGFFAGKDARDLYTLDAIATVGPDFTFEHGFDERIREVRIVAATALLYERDEDEQRFKFVRSLESKDASGSSALQHLRSAGVRLGRAWRLGEITFWVFFDVRPSDRPRSPSGSSRRGRSPSAAPGSRRRSTCSWPATVWRSTAMLSFLWKRLSEVGPQVSGRALRRFPDGEVERLLRVRVLIEHRRADTWPVCTHCDCGLDARPIRTVGDALRACCPYDPDEDEVLAGGDVRRFAIEPDRLARAIAASGGLIGGVSTVDEGIWLLGRTPAGRAVVACLDTQLLFGPGTALALKSVAAGDPVSVLATECGPADGLWLTEMGFAAHALVDVMEREEADVERLRVERLSPTAGPTRLVLDLIASAITFDGQVIDLPPQMFSAFRMLAEQVDQRDPVLRSQETEHRFDREARGVMRDLRKAIARCLSSEDADRLVETVRNRGYRVGLDPSEMILTR
ncbi:hypothetical protein [Acuticoccus sp.]|uniref:hypothetical protein n=1 Tax=Acuticoccus sp. TaxID=1904378 RepID=UPI003B52C80E